MGGLGRPVSMGDQMTYIVELVFRPGSACDREQLEAVAAHVADTLDENTSDAVLGSVVAVHSNPPTIAVDISIRAASRAALHRELAAVSELLDEVTRELADEGYSESTRAQQLTAA
jgi:hypothetical protein